MTGDIRDVQKSSDVFWAKKDEDQNQNWSFARYHIKGLASLNTKDIETYFLSLDV